MKTVAIALVVLLGGCGGLGGHAPTILRTTIGALWGSCHVAQSDLPRGLAAFCSRVEQLAPGALEQLGAGDPVLPADVAAREVTITIEDQ